MSLTSRLRGHTPLKEWLHVHMPLVTINRLLDEHNKLMSDVHMFIRPAGRIIFPKGGMAFTYAFRWWLRSELAEWLPDTVAWRGLQAANLEKAFIAHFNKFSPLGAVLLAEYDAAYRDDSTVSLLDGDRWYLPHDAYFEATVEDVGELYASIAGVFDGQVLAPPMVPNPSFMGSFLVGGADANMLMGNVLFDVRTTLKKKPLTLTNFYQQIMYYLLDLEDSYGIRQLGWYYSRQRSYFVYPVETFVPDPARTRADLAEFLLPTIDPFDRPELTFGLDLDFMDEWDFIG